MNFKKRVNGSWTDTPHYIHNTSTDTLTTLPAVLYPNAVTVTVGLKGQMSQTGTPTSSDPIQPQECGDLETEGAKAGQYKIPILSANTTTPVYLGEVESTRQIVKTVLTSSTNVDWAKSPSRNYAWYFSPAAIGTKAYTPFLCSHGATVTSVNKYVYGTVYCDNTVNLGIFPSTLTTVSSLKKWLDEQNANGTPVVIWNILATPTTGIVNEPLRKIGEYADEVTGISIPTTAGTNTISVDTTVQPSEVTVNYKGWHPVQSVHERENGQWD